MEENSTLLKKVEKGNKALIISAIICFIIGISFLVWGYNIKTSQLPTPKDMNDIICSESTNKENIYAKIDVQLVTDYFASFNYDSKNEKYYFIDDKDGYYYIVCLTDETFKKLEDIYNYTYNPTAEFPEPITITGITKNINSNLRNIAISQYFKVFSNNSITENNFDRYYGTIYLKEGEDPRDAEIQFCFMILALFFFALTFIMYLVNKISYKKLLKRDDYDEIKKEIESNEKLEFLKIGTILTKNYIIDATLSFKVFKYSDIDWIYELKQRGRYNVNNTLRLVVYTKNRKKHYIALTNTISKKTKNEFYELFNKLQEYIPNAMFGYTKENIQTFKGKRLL